MEYSHQEPDNPYSNWDSTIIQSNPLGSPWDTYASLTEANVANIDAAGMGHDVSDQSSSGSGTHEQVLPPDGFSDDSSDDEVIEQEPELLIAEEVDESDDEEPDIPVPVNNGGVPIAADYKLPEDDAMSMSSDEGSVRRWGAPFFHMDFDDDDEELIDEGVGG
jgi:hypothetical protein